MSAPTPEAVAALRERLQREWPVYGVKTDNAMLEAAAMLEALAAERDRLLDERGEYEKEMAQETIEAEARATAAESALEAAHQERDEAVRVAGLHSDEALLRERNEALLAREAARADNARLRAALERIAGMPNQAACIATIALTEWIARVCDCGPAPIGSEGHHPHCASRLAAPAAGSPPAETAPVLGDPCPKCGRTDETWTSRGTGETLFLDGCYACGWENR